MSSQTVIKLEYPIKVSGIEVSEIKMRRPTVRDLKAAGFGKVDDLELTIRLAANLAEWTPAEIESLDAADYTKVSEALAGFIKPSLA